MNKTSDLLSEESCIDKELLEMLIELNKNDLYQHLYTLLSNRLINHFISSYIDDVTYVYMIPIFSLERITKNAYRTK